MKANIENGIKRIIWQTEEESDVHKDKTVQNETELPKKRRQKKFGHAR